MISDVYALPLSGFFDCLFKQDFSVLGYEDAEAARTAWSDIYEQYLNLTNTQAVSQHKALHNSIIENELIITVVTHAVYSLMRMRDEELIKILRYRGFNFKFSADDTESFHKDLSKCIQKLEPLKRSIRENTALLNQVSGSQKPYGYADAVQDLAHLSKFMGYRIDPNKVSAGEYAAIRNTYFSAIEKIK